MVGKESGENSGTPEEVTPINSVSSRTSYTLTSMNSSGRVPDLMSYAVWCFARKSGDPQAKKEIRRVSNMISRGEDPEEIVDTKPPLLRLLRFDDSPPSQPFRGQPLKGA